MIKKTANITQISVNSFYTMSVIGKGSYSKVLLVKKKDDNKLYAMKVLKKHYIEKRKQERHIKAERDILVGLSECPFIVKLYYTFQTDKHLYFVLEYCAGGELFKLLETKRRLTTDQACFYAAQMVLALEHLHNHNIIYRDLKPENVLIDSTGYIKLTDFGLSRMNVINNNIKTICGTPEYLAPEIMMKLGYGKSVDWWTLGNIIYEMLVGAPPFYTYNRQEVFEKIRSSQPQYPKFLNSEAKDLIEKLLIKDPNKRLGSSRGASEVKNHRFFKNINWNSLKEMKYKPYYVPKVNEDNGLINFDTQFTQMEIYSLDAVDDSKYPCKNYEEFSWNYDNLIASNVRHNEVGTQLGLSKKI